MKHVDHRIQACCDGELTPAEREAFEVHIRECAACRREFEATRRLWDQVDAAAAVTPARPVWPGVAERIAGRGAQQRPWTWAQRGLAAAAVAAGIVLGFGLGAAAPERATTEVVSVSDDFLEDSLLTLDQLWIQAGDTEEDTGS